MKDKNKIKLRAHNSEVNTKLTGNQVSISIQEKWRYNYEIHNKKKKTKRKKVKRPRSYGRCYPTDEATPNQPMIQHIIQKGF